MACCARGTLSPLQGRVLDAFFEREKGFWLTGGAALAGFHLAHRETGALDLFTSAPAAFERGRPAVRDLAASLGLAVQVLQAAPGFQRHALVGDGEGLVVDLVLDRGAQLHAEKPEIDGVRVDPADEILANKLTTLVGRMEERDLVDVMLLERSGLRVEDLLEIPRRKDGGCTPAVLSWLLSEIRIPEGAPLPGGVDAGELREWLAHLIVRLRRLAFPVDAPP